MSEQKKLTTQMVQDIGEYFVCFVLSQMGFRAVRTSQNAKGVDILAYGEETLRPVTIQVKTNQEPPFPDVCVRTVASLGHGEANQDPNIKKVARLWVLVELNPDNSGKVKCAYVWDSGDKEDQRLLRAHKTMWALNTDLKDQRDEWARRKDKWERIAKVLNEAGE